MKHKIILLAWFLFLFPTFTQAATVYSQLGIGTNWIIASDPYSDNNSYQSYYPNNVTIIGSGSTPTSFGSFSVGSDFNFVKIRRVSGQTCTQLVTGGGVLATATSTGTTASFASVSFDNGTDCVFELNHTATAGDYYSVAVIGSAYNTVPTILAGSATNGGATTKGNYSAKITGGFAFQFCDISCDLDFEEGTNTHIVSFTPTNGTTTPSAVAVHFNLTVYIAPEDIGNGLGVQLNYRNIDQNVFLLGAFSDSQFTIFFGQATTSGTWTYSLDRVLGDGNYRVNAVIQRSVFGAFLNPFSSINDNQSHQFIVGTSTFIGDISQNSFTAISSIFGNQGATSTAALISSCNPLQSFNIANCVAFLFIPDGYLLNSTLQSFRSNVATHFPLGYITDFITILTDDNTVALPSFSVTIPSGLPASGTQLSLSLGNQLDYILNATATSRFSSSTSTFYETTSFYWELFVGMAALFYIIRRIMGKHLIPHIGHNQKT